MRPLLALLVAARVALAAEPAESAKQPAPPKPPPDQVHELLDHLHFNGYVQARYTNDQSSVPGVDAQGNPTVTDGFTVRRARVITSYDGPVSRLVTEFDVSSRAVALRRGEVHLVEPWSGHRFELVAGQMKWPFGYENQQSSADRELPEQSRVVRAFLPGEYDRGFALMGRMKGFSAQLGLYDGDGVGDQGFPNLDNDRRADLLGHLGADFAWISGGVSGWWGRTLRVAVPPAPAAYFDRTRVGADLQLKGTLLPLGPTALKTEWIRGVTWSRNGVEQFGLVAYGAYLLLVQDLRAKGFFAARFDWFDGDANAPDAAGANGRNSATNAVATLGLCLGGYWDEHLKVSAAYEFVRTRGPAADPADDVFTLQLQGRY